MNFKSLIKLPYNLFICAATVIAIASLFMMNDSVDFHLHDTYFVISSTYILWAVAFSLICVWGIYRTVRKMLLSNWLIWMHAITTMLLLIALSTSGLWFKENNPSSRRYYSDDSFQSLINEYGATFIIFLAIVVMFLVGQLAFVINIVAGLVRCLLTNKKKEKLTTKH